MFNKVLLKYRVTTGQVHRQGGTGTRTLGNPRVEGIHRGCQNREQVSVAGGGENSHIHTELPYGGSGTGRGEAEDVVIVVAGAEPGGQSVGQRYWRRRQTDSWEQADDQETMKCYRNGDTPNSPRYGQTGTTKCTGRNCGRGQA